MGSTYRANLTSVDTDTQVCVWLTALFNDVYEMESFYTSEYAQPLTMKKSMHWD